MMFYNPKCSPMQNTFGSVVSAMATKRYKELGFLESSTQNTFMQYAMHRFWPKDFEDPSMLDKRGWANVLDVKGSCQFFDAALPILERSGTLVLQRFSPQQAKEKISYGYKYSKHYPLKSGSPCEWCGGYCFVLEKHHFPIAQKDGGKNVVSICPECHRRFHVLVDRKTYRLSKRAEVFIDACAGHFFNAIALEDVEQFT